MPVILITPDSLKRQALQMRKYNKEQERIISNIKREISFLSDIWKGEAQDAFVNKFYSMNPIYIQLTEVLDEYAKLLDKAAETMANTDNSLSRKIKNID